MSCSVSLAVAGSSRWLSITDRSGWTKTPPLKPAIAPSSLSGAISMLMPRGGRPLVSASVMPASCNSRVAATAWSVNTLSCVTSVPSTSASSSRTSAFSFVIDGPSVQVGRWRSRRAGDPDLVIGSFPAVLPWPEHGESNNGSVRQPFRRQIENIQAETGRDGVAVGNGFPVVGRPADPRLIQTFQPQHAARSDAVDSRGRSPRDRRRRRGILQVAIERLRRRIEYRVVTERPQQLDMFGMRPYQRHGTARGPAEKQLPRGDVFAVPDLFRQQAAGAGGGFQRREQAPRLLQPPRRQFVMSPFAGEQRPQPADPRPVERRAAGMLAIAVVIIAIPVRARRQFAPEQRIDRLHGIENARIVGGPQAEAHQRERIGTDQQPSL